MLVDALRNDIVNYESTKLNPVEDIGLGSIHNWEYAFPPFYWNWIRKVHNLNITGCCCINQIGSFKMQLVNLFKIK